MKKLTVCLLCLLLLAACGKPSPTVIAGDAEESEAAYFDVGRPITAQTTLGDEAVTCKALQNDGGVYGFEMRFRQTEAVDALLCDPENVYFGVLETGKDKLAVPMEEIRILPDVTTNEFVLTLLVPQGETLSAGKCTVAFYIAAQSGDAGEALFCAKKTAALS